MSNKAKLLVADSDTNADLLWATRFSVCDPIIYFEWKGKSYLVPNDLEYGRAKMQAKVDKVLPLSDYTNGLNIKTTADMLHPIFKSLKIKHVLVPFYMSVSTVMNLKKKGYKVEIKHGPFFEERAYKTKVEKGHLKDSLKATEKAIQEAKNVLAKSKIKKNRIYYGGTLVTSEFLKKVIGMNLFEKGYIPHNTIVAGGKQGCDPHNTGSGPILPHYPIVIDVFPRSEKTGYYGDITRTVIKGTVSDVHGRMQKAVREAQEVGFKGIRHNVNAAALHKKVQAALVKRGFITERIKGKPVGFITGTGHGLGLDIHEPPRFGAMECKLKKGHVVTVEPGLYYPEHGGMRVEDVVYVTKTGIEHLTTLNRSLHIP